MVYESGGIGSEEYIEILSEGLLSFIDDILGSQEGSEVQVRELSDITFIHDDTSYHQNTEVTSFLADEGIQVMRWPAQSSDLNPIKNLWSILKVKFHDRFTDLRCSVSKSQGAEGKYGEILQEVWG